MEFENRSVVITGASTGIGRATALLFAQQGAKLLISDINEEEGQKTLAQVQEIGAPAQFVKVDVSQKEEVEALLERCVSTYKSLDHLVNNAGVGQAPTFFEDTEDDTWHKVISVNQTGVFYGMRAALKIMKSQKKGTIVNTSSMLGRMAAPQAAAYSASKFAVLGLTKAAAAEYGKYGIRINAVCPGLIETPMTDDLFEVSGPHYKDFVIKMIPARRIGAPEEIAQAIGWLSSEKSSYMNGVGLPIDGGFRI